MESEVDFSGDLSSGSCGTKVVYLSGKGIGIITYGTNTGSLIDNAYAD
jgi:hypothetical protein